MFHFPPQLGPVYSLRDVFTCTDIAKPLFWRGGGVPLNYDFEFYGGEARFTQEKIENHYTGQVEKTTLQSLYIPVHRKKTATLKGWQRWNPVDHS